MARTEEHSAVVIELAEEFVERYRRGERPPLSEYIDRHPEFAEEIREVFPAMALMENIALDEADLPEGRSVSGPISRPTRLGEFRVLREIARGGMGVVYEAEQESLGRRVALKVLPNQMLRDENQKKRFRREARAAAGLHHTNIVPVFGVGEQDGMHYYAMQFIYGQGLDEVLVELKRLAQPEVRDQKSEVSEAGEPRPSVAPRVPQPVTSLVADASAVEIARSLHTGQFRRILIAEADDDAPREGGAPADPSDETPDPSRSRPPDGTSNQSPSPQTSHVPPGRRDLHPPGEGPGVRGTTPDTATARLSDTATLSSSAVLPGQSAAEMSASGWTYWQSVARIGIQVAEALQHAHDQGILHRDVKPGNLLLDTAGTVWVTDFGLAKTEDEQNLTGTGDVVGTLRYMAPEVFEGKTDERSDVCSLGLTLYELLALRPAFDETHRARLVRQVAHETPPPLRALNRDIPRDLAVIVHKATDRDPAARYQTAGELADDLRRFVEAEPIRARRTGKAARLWRWCRRNPAVASLSTAIVVLLHAGIVLLTISNMRVAGERDAKETALQEARQQRQAAEKSAQQSRRQAARLNVALGIRTRDEGDLLGSLPWFARALLLDQGDPARAELDRVRLGCVLAECPRLLQVFFDKSGNSAVHYAEFSPDGTRMLIAAGPCRVIDLRTGRTIASVHSPGGIQYATFGPQGRRIATASVSGVGRVWETETGDPVTPPLQHSGKLRCARFSPEGRRVVTAGEDGTARIWDAETGELLSPLTHDDTVHEALFGPQGKRVLTASEDGTARIWKTATGDPLTTLRHKAGVRAAAFGPAGRRVATGRHGAVAQVWDAETGDSLAKMTDAGSGGWSVSFGPEGERLLTGGMRGAGRIWEADTGEPTTPPLQHAAGVRRATFSPDGRYVATASGDGTARVWHAMTGKPITPPLKHGKKVKQATFSPDGALLLTASWDGTARLWVLPSPEPDIPSLKHDGRVTHAEFSPDGRFAVTAGRDNTARVWDAETGKPLGPPLRHSAPVRHAAFSPDGQRVVTGCEDGTARVWNVQEGEIIASVAHEDTVRSVTFSPDGRRIATASADGSARVWNADSGEPVTPELTHPGKVGQVVFLSDGEQVATACAGGQKEAARTWDSSTGEPITPPLEHGPLLSLTCFLSTDSRRRLLTYGGHHSTLWDAETGKRIARLPQGNSVRDGSFSPDGNLVVTASWDETARIWDTATGEPAKPPLRHNDRVDFARFSPDGRLVLTVTRNGAARLWDAATGEPLSPPLDDWGAIEDPVFAPDGERILATSGNEARILSLPREDRPVGDVVRMAELLSGRKIEEEGETFGFVPIATDELRRNWDAFRSKYPQEFAPDERRLLAWHCQEIKASRKSGQWKAALLHLEAAIGTLEKPTATHTNLRGAEIRLAEACSKLVDSLKGPGDSGWSDAAIREFAYLLSRAIEEIDFDPARFELHLASARTCWRRLQRFEAASADLQKAEKLASGTRQKKKLARESFWWGDRHYHDSEYDQALPKFSEAIRLNHEHAKAYSHRGQIYLHKGELDKALADFNEALRLGGAYGALTYSGRAKVLYRKGDYESALADYSKAIELKPKEALFWHNRAHAYVRLEKWDAAFADFAKALELEPKNVSLLTCRAADYSAQGKWEKAIEDFVKAVDLDPDNPLLHYQRALAQLGRNDLESYRDSCATMLDQFAETDDPDTAHWVAWTCLLAPEAVPDLSGPVALAEKAVAEEPGSGNYRNTLGGLLYRSGRFEQAIDSLREVVGSWGQDAEATRYSPAYTWYFLAMAHHRLGHLEKARTWLEKANAKAEAELNDKADPPSWNRRLTLQLFRRKAEQLVDGDNLKSEVTGRKSENREHDTGRLKRPAPGSKTHN